MAIALKAYYDGSGKSHPNSKDRFLSLGGYAGTWPAWEALERRWAEVLSRWPCEYMHMHDAFHLNDHFAEKRGWTHEMVEQLQRELSNECLSPIANEFRGQFVGTCCTVSLDEFGAAVAARPGLPDRYKVPEAICVWDAVRDAFRLLVPPEGGIPERDARVELHFDYGESFQHPFKKVWEKTKDKDYPIFRNIVSIGSADAKQVPGLQAADMAAWTANLAYNRGDETAALKLQVPALSGIIHHYRDGDQIGRILDQAMEDERQGAT